MCLYMKTPKQVFEDEKAPASVLLVLATKKYTPECYDWEPAVLKAEIHRDFDCELSDLQSDKLQAAITILTTDLYESNIKAFETMNYLLNHQPDNLDELNPLEAEELICGLTEAYMIRGEQMQFSPEVRVYAGLIFHEYGMHQPPVLFNQAIMDEREGNDDEKNEALHEIFSAKIKITEEYLKKCTH